MENEKRNDEYLFVEPNKNTISTPVETNENTVFTPVETIETQKKKGKIIPVIISLVVILALAFGGYYILTSSPKYVFDKAFESATNYLIESMYKTSKYNTAQGEGKLNYEINTTDETMKELTKVLNGITLDYNYAVDFTNKLVSFDLNSNYNNEKLIDLKMYTENQKGYFLLKNVFEKYISVDIEEYDEIFKVKEEQENVKVIINSIEKAYKKSLTKEDYKKEKTQITINNKEEKVTKNSLVIDKNNIKRILEDFLTTLKNDSEFVKAVENLIQDEEIDVKTELENLITELKEEPVEEAGNITVSIYTKGLLKEVVKYEIELIEEDIKGTVEITKAEEGKYTYKITSEGQEVVTGTMNITVKEKAKKIESDIELTMNVNNMFDLKINTSVKETYGVKVEKENVTNSISIDELTEEDTNNIMTKIMENKGFANLMMEIGTMFGA